MTYKTWPSRSYTAKRLELTLSWPSKFSWVTFHGSSSLVCQFLLLGRFIETSTTKGHPLVSQRDLHLLCKLRMMFTWTRNVEKTSYHDWDFPVMGRNELKSQCWDWLAWSRGTVAECKSNFYPSMAAQKSVSNLSFRHILPVVGIVSKQRPAPLTLPTPTTPLLLPPPPPPPFLLPPPPKTVVFYSHLSNYQRNKQWQNFLASQSFFDVLLTTNRTER